LMSMKTMQSQSPDVNPIKHEWEILEWCLRQGFPPSLTKDQIMKFLMEEWCRNPLIEFQTLVESMWSLIEAVLTHGGPFMLADTCMYILSWIQFLDSKVAISIEALQARFQREFALMTWESIDMHYSQCTGCHSEIHIFVNIKMW
jgi:hypothetical protein